MFPATYFPTTYFPGTYWPPSGSEVAPAPAPLRDQQILNRFADLLQAADAFHEVTSTGAHEEVGRSAEHYRKVSIDILGFAEESRWSEPDGKLGIERTVDIALTVYVRDADPRVRDREADRLYCLAANTISQQSLDRRLVADLCAITRGRYVLVDVERRIECRGRIVYLIDGADGRATADDIPL